MLREDTCICILSSLFHSSLSLSPPPPPPLFLFINSLSKSLSEAQEKIIALEEQLDQLLKKKNSAILDLESLIHHLEKELQLALERLEQMKRTLEAIDRARAGSGGDDGLDREMTSLHENVDVLIRQFKAALEEIERSRSR